MTDLYEAITDDGYASLDAAGIYGYGRCDRCGESFREDDEQAEIAGTTESPAALLLDNLIIHAACLTDSDVLA